MTTLALIADTHTPDISHTAGRGGLEYRFDNGYGASVIQQRGTSTLFEVAVLDAGGDIVTDSEHINGVFQYLGVGEVRELLDRIADAPTRNA